MNSPSPPRNRDLPPSVVAVLSALLLVMAFHLGYDMGKDAERTRLRPDMPHQITETCSIGPCEPGGTRYFLDGLRLRLYAWTGTHWEPR
jgi:hypothetical protein